MKRIGPPLIISLLAISLPIQAQEKSVRVDLGIVFFTLTLESEKNLIPIPMSLTAEPGTKIARVDSEITFPASYLSFVKGSTKIDHAKFEASVRSDPENPEQSRLLIVVSSVDDQSLPIGVIAALELPHATPLDLSCPVLLDGAPALEHRPLDLFRKRALRRRESPDRPRVVLLHLRPLFGVRRRFRRSLLVKQPGSVHRFTHEVRDLQE